MYNQTDIQLPVTCCREFRGPFFLPQALLIRDLRSCSVAGAVLQEISQRKSIGVRSADFGSRTPFPSRKSFYRTVERNNAYRAECTAGFNLAPNYNLLIWSFTLFMFRKSTLNDLLLKQYEIWGKKNTATPNNLLLLEYSRGKGNVFGTAWLEYVGRMFCLMFCGVEKWVEGRRATRECHFVIACWQGHKNIHVQKIVWHSGNKMWLGGDAYCLAEIHWSKLGDPAKICVGIRSQNSKEQIELWCPGNNVNIQHNYGKLAFR